MNLSQVILEDDPFATNHYGKIPTSYLIYVAGHSSEEMFLNYIGKSNKDIALELTKYF